MFISFEGLDFCGKSTQAKLLYDHLKKSGKKAMLLREPGGTAISEKVREILLDKVHDEMFPLTEFLLFSASRAQLVNQIIKPEVKKGTTIICDRYFDSSTAYQGYAGKLDIQEVEYVNKFATGNLFPDITFFIDLPPQIAWERALIQKKKLDRIENKNITYYNKVYKGFKEIYKKKRKGFYLLNGRHSIEDIHKEVVSILKKYI
jgi:dTMP kinase